MATEILQIDTQDFTSQVYKGQDINLISTFDLNTSFSSSSYIEFFIYDNNRNLITFDYNFTDYTIQNDGQSAGNNEEISQIIIHPEQSLTNRGFNQGIYIAYFNFFNKKIGSDIQQLYIAEISSDRTELRLDSTILSNLDIIEQTTQFVQEREDSTYFLDFYLNFGENQLAIANNIQLDNTDPNNPTILIKLYEPLPEGFDLNSTAWVTTILEESIAYKVIFEDDPIVFIDFENISGPNFNIDLKDRVNNSTQNVSYTDLISTSLTSSIQQLNSLLEEKEIDINVDYTSFENFIHFSSAQTRLENFYSKIQLIEQYSASLAILDNTTNSPISISSSAAVYEIKINNIITNFDGYEYFLYYEDSPYAWPKTNTQKPYELAKSDSATVLTWIGSTNEYSPYFGGLLNSASLYDNNNKDNLLYTIPEYLRDDPENQQYELFVQMVAQHYDNIWIYYKEVTQKYNADNRLEYGISKDIVADAIRDFGIKLYQNNFSNEDLYTAFLGLTPEGGLFPFPNITGSLPTPSGFEYIEYFISASNDYIPLDDVNKSLYKRIYHNIPYLLKTKGTLPGLRALITSYGIPDTILRINEYGGKDKADYNDWDYWQNEFNYSFYTEGNNFISSSFAPVNSSWNTTNSVPESLMFRFKSTLSPDIDPSSSLLIWNNVVSNWNSTPYIWNAGVSSPFSQSLWSKQFDTSYITLTYTGSGYASGSYSGSIIDPYYQYATLTFYPSYANNPTVSASVYLPFFDGGWWSVMVNVDTSPTPNYNFTLYAANKIYEGGDNGTLLGFMASSSVIIDGADWDTSGNCYFASSSLVNGVSYTSFSGSLQEIRYYTNPISESVFRDYVMNPYSIEGNSTNSSPNELIFRASLGGELYTGSNSIHPKVTGSWVTTQSFTSNSDFYFDQTPIFIPNREYFFYDQPIAGIKNTISDKIRIENNVMPEGDTLSPFMSLSQMTNISQSYTQNINYLEVAFSPSNEINEDIMDQIGSFNIGEYIGDPRLRSSSAVTYPALDQLRDEYFQKYTKNYDLVDFIRLIKFFDNSLFKMIRDFVPARTSLAAGIVIKQHLLERNKYPQPQMEWENLDISGTLKPTWNGYEPGTVENFEGQTGGVFDLFNSVLNTSQSWYENVITPSGSITILHDSQDEFYNGEFSGSTILISDGILNEAFPTENQVLFYTPVRYSNTQYGLNSNSIFTQNQFLNPLTSPTQGEILLLTPRIQLFPFTIGPRFVKIHKIDNNGKDNSIALEQANQLLIKYSTSNTIYTLKILSKNEYTTYYLYQVDTLGSNTADNYILDYTVSASRITPSFAITPGDSKPIQSLTESIDNLGYFNPTDGILTFPNTPNITIKFTASLNLSSSGNANTSSLTLIKNGDTTDEYAGSQVTSTRFILNSGVNNIIITGSFYPLAGDTYYLRLWNDTNPSDTSTTTFNSIQLQFTQSTAPSSPENDPILLEPYITTPNFYNSDENALINNSDGLRDSSYYMDVDYASGITTPINFDFLISGSATKAKVQDSNYTTLRHITPRYLGSKSTSQKLNTWSPPNTIEGYSDQGTYGKLPTIESLKSFVAYGYMDGSYAPERMNTSVFRIKYLIDQDGNISTPNISNISLPTIQQNFPTGDRFRYASILGQSSGGGIENQFRNIIRGGYRIEPILYTQSGSTPSAQWNTTINFQDIIPSDTGAVQNYTALYGKTGSAQIFGTPGIDYGVPVQVKFNQTIYGAPISLNSYTIPLGAVQDGVNLIIESNVRIKLFTPLGPINPYSYIVTIYIYKNSNPIYQDTYSPVNVYPNSEEFVEFSTATTLNAGNYIVGDTISTYIKVDSYEGYPGGASIFNQNTSLKISQYPSYTQPVTSSGANSLWGYPNSGSYPYIITSSNQTLVELYNTNVKQIDITGSGFNPIELPWSIKYADEFRFEGREDFIYTVRKIFSPADSGSGRIFPTGSIEVHFDKNLPISASTSIFNLDHFLIRRYVEDSSLIIFEGFRPTNGGNPNSFIITPEYVIPQLDKSTDEYVKLLTEKGLIS